MRIRSALFAVIMAVSVCSSETLAQWTPDSFVSNESYSDFKASNFSLALPKPIVWKVKTFLGSKKLLEINTSGGWDVGYSYDFWWNIGEGIDVGQDGWSYPELMIRTDMGTEAAAWLHVNGPRVHTYIWGFGNTTVNILKLMGLPSDIDEDITMPRLSYGIPFKADVGLLIKRNFESGIYAGDYSKTTTLNVASYLGIPGINLDVGFARGLKGSVEFGLNSIDFYDGATLIGKQVNRNTGVDVSASAGKNLSVSKRNLVFNVTPSVGAGIALLVDASNFGFSIKKYFKKKGQPDLLGATVTKSIDIPIPLPIGSHTYAVPAVPAGGVATAKDAPIVLPFSDQFEGVTLNPSWVTESINYDSVTGAFITAVPNATSLSALHIPHAGNKHLLMDNGSVSGSTLNELTVALNLKGERNVTLSFWYKSIGGVYNPMPSTFAGKNKSDGVAVSVDKGVNWIRISSLDLLIASRGAYQQYTVNLDDILGLYGLQYNEDVRIKFQRYGAAGEKSFFDDIIIGSGVGLNVLSKRSLQTKPNGLMEVKLAFEVEGLKIPQEGFIHLIINGVDTGAISGTNASVELASTGWSENITAELRDINHAKLSPNISRSMNFTLFGGGSILKVPFSDGFESYTPNADIRRSFDPIGMSFSSWFFQSESSDIPGAVFDNTVARTGVNALVFQTNNINSIPSNEHGTLRVDLLAKTGVHLSFWHKAFDASSLLLPRSFTGIPNANGVAVSVDGINWFKVTGLSTNDGITIGSYKNFDIDLDAIFKQYNLTYTNDVRIRFLHYGSLKAPAGGYAIDDVSITAGNPPSTSITITSPVTQSTFNTNLSGTAAITVDVVPVSFAMPSNGSWHLLANGIDQGAVTSTTKTIQLKPGSYQLVAKLFDSLGSALLPVIESDPVQVAVYGALSAVTVSNPGGNYSGPVEVIPAHPSGHPVYCTLDGSTPTLGVMTNPDGTQPEITKIIVDSANVNVLYAATNGGVFKSIDGGVIWSSSNVGLSNLNINSLTIDPANAAVLYAGTLGGIFKSNDGGATWFSINIGLLDMNINTVMIDPSNSLVLYAGSHGGLFKSLNGGVSWAASDPLLLSSYTITSIAIDPTSPNILYVGSTAGLFSSSNGGGSWTPNSGSLNNPNVTFIRLDPLFPHQVYIATTIGLFTGALDAFQKMNWYARDAGLKVARLINGVSTLIFSPLTSFSFDPINSSNLYAGSSDGLFKSIDGGVNWTASNAGLSNLGVSVLGINANAPALFYAEVQGYLFKSTINPVSIQSSQTLTCNAIDALGNSSPTLASSYNISPYISMLSPVNGGQYSGSGGGARWQPISIQSNMHISPLNSHWHLIVDGVDQGPILTALSTSVLLPLGAHTLVAELRDTNHAQLIPNISASAAIIIVDSSPPVISTSGSLIVGPSDINGTPATNPAIAALLASATATDNVDGVIPIVTNNAPSVFPIGQTTILFSAVDNSGNIGSAGASVIVDAALDTTPPVITAPNFTVNVPIGDTRVSSSLASLKGYLKHGVSAVDNLDGLIKGNQIVNDMPNWLPLGTTVVTFTATDGSGNSSISTANILVQVSPVLTNFAAPIIIKTPAVAGGVAGTSIGDFNGDAIPDLAVANGKLIVYAGDGLGGFSKLMQIPSGGILSVVSADVNADGKVDLLALDEVSGILRVFLGNGIVGSWFTETVGVTLNPALGITTGFSSGDVTGNGILDVMLLGNNNVIIFQGDGQGNFTQLAVYPVGTLPMDIINIDLNHDTFIDLVVVNRNSNDVSVLLSDGMGGFAAPVNYTVGNTPVSLAIGDLNGDNNLDITVVNSTSDNISMLIGDGAGGFATAINMVTAFTPSAVSIADVNGDGNTDIAVANKGSNSVRVYYGDGTGLFATQLDFTTLQGVNGTKPLAMTLVDSNGSGLPDIITVNKDGTLSVLINQIDGLAPVVTVPSSIVVEAVDASGTPNTDVAIVSLLASATATDNIAVVAINDNAPAIFPLGSTTVVFSASDAAGNIGTVSTVVTVLDSVAPNVVAPSPISVAASDINGVAASNQIISNFLISSSASDAVDLSPVFIGHNAPDPFPIGDTVVSFSYLDASGNTGSTSAVVSVVDMQPPVISILGQWSSTVVQGTVYVDAGATAVDNIDGNLTGSISVNNSVNTSVAGTYTVIYNVTDLAGNSSVQVIRTVNVVINQPPVISLTGPVTVTIVKGSVYTDSGATAFDDVDGNLTSNIITVNSVNSAVVGSYTVIYDVRDAMGNAASQVLRTVNVIPVGGVANFNETVQVPLTGSMASVDIYSAGQSISNFSAVSSLGLPPVGVSLPIGVLSYTTTVSLGGSSQIVHLTFSSPLPSNFVLYYVDNVGSYLTIPKGPGGDQWLLVDGTSIDVTLSDGGQFDSDGVADGVVTSSVAIAVPTANPTANPGSSTSQSGGCIIELSQSMALTPYVLLLLSVVWVTVRRRRNDISVVAPKV